MSPTAWKLLFVGVAAVLIVTLVLVARRAEQQPPVPPEVTRPHQQPALHPLTQVRGEVEAFLGAHVESPRLIVRERSGESYHYLVRTSPPSAEMVDGFRERLSRYAGYRLEQPSLDELRVSVGGTRYFTITFTLPPEPVSTGPRVAIIMDDLGRGLYPAQVLLALDQPVTFSILPGETDATRVAEMSHAAGRPVMLHIPMEPQGYPAVKPGADALFVKYDDNEIRWRLIDFLARVPYAVGANNHMGSRFTEDARALAPVMEVLKGRNLFFLDSLTTGLSKAAEVAREHGVKTLERDLFLDNVADVEKISAEIWRLGERAKRDGQAIGLCHPYSETLQALREVLPELEAQGVQVVPITALLP